MKIRILRSTTLHGRAVAAGEILEVTPGDYQNLAEYKLCEEVKSAPVEAVIEAAPKKFAKGKQI